jgi:membrane associated rhomboid family serine protease
VFILLPVGVERAVVRIPVISGAIAAICLLLLVTTWGLPGGDGGNPLYPLLDDWETHPYLELSPALIERAFQGKTPDGVAQVRMAWLSRHQKPDALTVAAEQAAFDALQQRALFELDHRLYERLTLSEKKGAQLGWVSHMFLHAGWMHFLFNMLFLYLCGPLLEDMWGRRLFLVFYLAGGLLAAAAEVVASGANFRGMVGASGAIAACMGAFAVRFATRKVSIAWFLWIFRPYYGVWHWPAWVCGILWFGDQLLSYASQSSPGVAVMAHLGGFGFGAAFAFGMKAVGLERSFVATSDQEMGAPERSFLKEVEEARRLLADGDRIGARRTLTRTLAGSPSDEDAVLMLARLDFEDGFKERAAGRVEKLLQGLLDQGRGPDAAEKLWTVWAWTEPELLSPALCAALVPHLKATSPDSPMVEVLEKRLAPPAPVTAPVVPPRVIDAVLEGLSVEGLVLRSLNGQSKPFAFTQFLAVAAALVPELGDASRSRLVIDLVLQQAPLVTVSLDSTTTQVARFVVGSNAREAWSAFFAAVLDGSKARAMPSAEALRRGEFPRFESVEAYRASLTSGTP